MSPADFSPAGNRARISLVAIDEQVLLDFTHNAEQHMVGHAVSGKRPRVTALALVASGVAVFELIAVAITRENVIAGLLLALGLGAAVPSLTYARGNLYEFASRLDPAVLIESPLWAKQLSMAGSVLIIASGVLIMLPRFASLVR